MGLTGLWHGASWNFVLWGLYFGLLIALERAFLLRVLEALPRAAGHLYLLVAVVLGWALFYFEDFGRLAAFLRLIAGAGEQAAGLPELGVLLRGNLLWLALALLLCVPLREPVVALWQRGPGRWEAGPALATGIVACFNLAALLLATAMLVGKTYNPFLYFRF